MKIYLNNIVGGITFDYWLSCLIFGLIGFALYKWATYDPAVKQSSPNFFSFKYWIDNNKADMFGGVLIFYIWIRFKNEIFMATENHELSLVLAKVSDSFFIHILFGVFFTHIVRRLRKSIRKFK